jgi:hypothetical protein
MRGRNERKGPPLWPWLAGILLLTVLIWMLVERAARYERARERIIAPSPELGIPR